MYDLIVIGGGPAGEKGAAQAAYFGHSVLLIDAGARPGGAAVHTGTLPSKTLRETALYLSGYRSRDLYGVSVELDDPHAAVPKLIARKDAIANLEASRIERNLEQHGVRRVQGRAHFVGRDEVEIVSESGSERARARFFLIATGSLPRDPDNVAIVQPQIFDSDEILHLEHLPDTMAILGGGVIGCEYACMFAALGVRVTLVDARDQLLPFLDREIAGRLQTAIERLGVTIRLGTKWVKAEHVEGIGVVSQLDPGGELVTENLLFAAGRVGATSKLGLEALGLVPTKRGHLEVDARYRTSLEHVYAAGDVIGFPALASTSMEQARVAICDAFGIDYKKTLGPKLPYGIYTIPEVSTVGESEESARAAGIEFVVGRAQFAENARGLITGDLEGLTKLIVHRHTRRLIGVHVIGERASELVHIGHAVMHLGGTVDAFIEMVFNYPTLCESYKYAAYDALGQLDA